MPSAKKYIVAFDPAYTKDSGLAVLVRVNQDDSIKVLDVKKLEPNSVSVE